MKQLFCKAPYCINTMKTLCNELLRKRQKKPNNMIKILKVVCLYLEYSEFGGDLEQW